MVARLCGEVVCPIALGIHDADKREPVEFPQDLEDALIFGHSAILAHMGADLNDRLPVVGHRVHYVPL